MYNREHNAFTLVEMLVATAITLLLVYGMASAFGIVSGTIASNRATLEMAGQIRGVSLQLQQDLEGVTVPLTTWTSISSATGYFEYREGLQRDFDGTRVNDTHMGDYDDILMLTSRNTATPFRGQINSAYLGTLDAQSSTAEIIWWTRLEDTDGNGVWNSGERFTLHRRTLLVMPELNRPTITRSASASLPSYTTFAAAVAGIAQFMQNNDLSVHLESNGSGGFQIVANTLANLSVRANRFGHVPLVYGTGGGVVYPPGGFPSILDLADGRLATSYRLTGTRIGEDVVLPNCIGFDVKAFDPMAIVQEDSAALDSLIPNDPGYGIGTTPTGAGTFVDLNYAGIRGTSFFSGPPELRSGLSGQNGVTTRQYLQPSNQISYDTWSTFYEHDGVNQDIDPASLSVTNTWTPPPPSGQNVWLIFPDEALDPTADSLADESFDGRDNLQWVIPPVVSSPMTSSRFGTDDIGERETSPPYPVPLRGLQVRIRMYEPDTRQVRQATVVSDFTPE